MSHAIPICYYGILSNAMPGSSDDALRCYILSVAILSSCVFQAYYLSRTFPMPFSSLESHPKDKPLGYQTLHLPIELYVLEYCAVWWWRQGAHRTIHLRKLTLRCQISFTGETLSNNLNRVRRLALGWGRGLLMPQR